MKQKPLFELDHSTATSAETREAFAAGLRVLADNLADGTDGGPLNEQLGQVVVIFDYEHATRAVAMAQDALCAYESAYHALQRALFREMIRRADAGETVEVCAEVLQAFFEYLKAEGKDVRIDNLAATANETRH